MSKEKVKELPVKEFRAEIPLSVWEKYIKEYGGKETGDEMFSLSKSRAEFSHRRAVVMTFECKELAFYTFQNFCMSS